MWEVNYGCMAAWIRKDKDRNARYIEAQNDRNEWDREAILREFRRIGFSDITKLFDNDGNILPMDEWPEEVARNVSSYEKVEEFEGSGKEREQVGWRHKIKMWDKSKALENLGKNLSMFANKHEHSLNSKLEDLITASWEDDDESGQ
jgi:hypothetical protein